MSLGVVCLNERREVSLTTFHIGDDGRKDGPPQFELLRSALIQREERRLASPALMVYQISRVMVAVRSITNWGMT